MAKIGQTLSAPETGWRRYDDVDNHFKYSESARRVQGAASSFYNGTVMVWDVVGVNTVKFIAYCSKLRIIAQPYTTRSNSVEVEIDGNVVGTYSLKTPSGVNQCLVYEKTGLSLGYHSVTLTDRATGNFIFDAIDIDSNGHMLFLAGDTMLNSNITETYNQDIDIVGSFEFFGEVSNIRYRYLVNGVAQPWSAFGSYTTFNISVPYTLLDYGVNEIKVEVETVEEKTSFAFINVTRVITELIQPPVVYANKVTLEWLPILSPEKIDSIRLEKNSSQSITVTGELYEDAELFIDAVYTYKIIANIGLLEVASNSISITTPNEPHLYYLWQDGAYIIKVIEGISFDSAEVDYDFYTTPDKVIIKPLVLGDLIGGRVGNVFAFEVFNTYEDKDFTITLYATDANQNMAIPFDNYGEFQDSDNPDWRSWVVFDYDNEFTSEGFYPAIFELDAGQKKVIYCKFKPGVDAGIGQKVMYVIATTREVNFNE